jgi:hypothetical protein
MQSVGEDEEPGEPGRAAHRGRDLVKAVGGIDDTLALEAVYYAAPIPRDLATLTVLGAVFDKVHFPGVHLPKDGFDEAALDREIARIEALPNARTDYDTALLIDLLKLAKHARTLEGFCVFSNTDEDPFKASNSIPAKMVADISDAIHGPPPNDVIPIFSTNHHKELPGGHEHVTYPGNYHYLAGAILESARLGVPLLNDQPWLPIPGIDHRTPHDKAKVLSAILAIECTKLILPPTPVLRPAEIMEFRAANAELLHEFRKSMLRYAADLNAKISGLSSEDFEHKTRFFIETEIVPTMDDLRLTMNDPAQPWHRRAIGGLKVIPSIAGAYFTGGASAALMKALTSYASQFFVEVGAHGDRKGSLKRCGLYYLLQLRKFHEDKPGS